MKTFADHQVRILKNYLNGVSVKRESVNRLVLLFLVAIISAVFLTMIHQFLMPIFMAGLISAMTSPTHQWISKRIGGRENIGSVLIILAMIFLILGPLSILVSVVIAQAISVGQSVTPAVQALINEPTVMSEYLEKLPYYDQVLPYRDTIIERAGEIVGNVTSFLINSLSSVTRLTVSAIFGSIIMLYTMFYFLTMGDVLLNKILYFLPLCDADEQRLLGHFTSVARATIKGTLIIGIMQGSICGLSFFLAGINGPVFWGTVMAVTSIIPAFGTAIVWIPAVVILAITGNFSGVIILLVGCGAIAGNLDNIVRPRLVGKDTEMHDLYILFSTLGGISMFGILGIIIGPIIAALFITIWEIYGDSFQEFLPDVEIFSNTDKSKEDIPGTIENNNDEEAP